MTVVLLTCCGPCASACVPRLTDDGHEVTMLFANSNIDTREEFEKRKAFTARAIVVANSQNGKRKLSPEK